MLQIFLNLDQYSETTLTWTVAMHLTFVVSALMLGFLEKVIAKPKPAAKPADRPAADL